MQRLHDQPFTKGSMNRNDWFDSAFDAWMDMIDAPMPDMPKLETLLNRPDPFQENK